MLSVSIPVLASVSARSDAVSGSIESQVAAPPLKTANEMESVGAPASSLRSVDPSDPSLESVLSIEPR